MLEIMSENSKMQLTPIDIIRKSAGYLAGVCGGCAGLVFGHPFDTIKVRQQTLGGSCGTIANCLKISLTIEGPRGLFKGLAFPLVSVGLLNGLFFGVYGNIRPFVGNTYSDMFIAGGIAGAVQGIPGCTIELIKVKLQSQMGGKNRYQGPYDCFRKIYMEYGIRGCFKGLPATICREVIGFGIYITTYEALCKYGTPEGHQQTPIRVMLIAGGLGGVFSWIGNIPMDIIKNRLQADDMKSPTYRNSWHCIVASFKKDGARVFWKGLPITCIRAFPVNAVTFAVYSQSFAAIQRL
ncbi:DgyrCDS690 [Dimorphilus gyrociliatus]|uniref:DgyrCDS690 n=1 Tax=Dimorphilus gyrociliatus TaxID=2664684 RepID=A0A7I8V7X6_9ANNE|nr:DgyrCDS690 [Dimorphilus gyrociliatus]